MKSLEVRPYGDVYTKYIDGVKWELENPNFTFSAVVYDHDKDTVVSITPADGFIFDFASVPWLFRRIFPPAGSGTNGSYGPAALLHDWLYRYQEIHDVPIKKAYADLVFYWAMMSPKYAVSPKRAMIMHLAVKYGGYPTWIKRKKELKKEAAK